MTTNNRLTPAEVRRIVQLYHEGWGYRSISRIIGRSERSVENVLSGKHHTRITGGRVSRGKRPANQLQIYSHRKKET